MKHLIKKILHEQTLSEAWSPDNEHTKGIEPRVRLVMKQLQKIPHLDTFIEAVRKDGFDRGYYGHSSTLHSIQKIVTTVNQIPKLMGGDIRHFSQNEFVWLAVNTFINNGGYQRDYSDINDPLDLTPITVWEVDAEYKQPYVEYGTIWGTPYGARTKQEAEEMMMDDPYTWEVDREHSDSDDYGDTEVYELGKTSKRELEFSKGTVGLS